MTRTRVSWLMALLVLLGVVAEFLGVLAPSDRLTEIEIGLLALALLI